MEVDRVVTRSFAHQTIIRLKILKTDFGFNVEIWNSWTVVADIDFFYIIFFIQFVPNLRDKRLKTNGIS